MKYRPNPCLAIREACTRDAEDMSTIIRTCIETTHGQNYSAEEIGVWKGAYTTDAIERFFNKNRLIYLLQAGGETCGTVQFDGACKEIKAFYFHPHYQHRGYGTILLLYLLGQLKSSGVRTVQLSSNRFFKGFYELFSFHAVRKETVVWGGLEFEEYRMQKTLTN